MGNHRHITRNSMKQKMYKGMPGNLVDPVKPAHYRSKDGEDVKLFRHIYIIIIVLVMCTILIYI